MLILSILSCLDWVSFCVLLLWLCRIQKIFLYLAGLAGTFHIPNSIDLAIAAMRVIKLRDLCPVQLQMYEYKSGSCRLV